MTEDPVATLTMAYQSATETGSQVCRSSITTSYLKEDKRTLKISARGKSPVLPHFWLPPA